MTSTEARARAAMRAIAGTVNDAPPLPLTAGRDPGLVPGEARPGEDGRGSRQLVRRPGPGRSRRRRRWSVLAPIAAAAVVVALALSLVLVKDRPNGSVAPKNPAPSTAVPAGVPRYYVALKQLAGDINSSNQRNDIVVGDSLTGKLLATFAPPARTVFESVTAAADDRTFAVFAVTSANGSFQAPAKDSALTGSWYAVRLAPGTAHQARLTLLPVKPLTAPASAANYGYANEEMNQLTDSFGSVLSGSGQELAVPEWTAHGTAVKVFSVTTGQLLHEWTAAGPFIYYSLTWIDGGRELALGGLDEQAMKLTSVRVYEWPVTEPDNGDLLARSTLVWDPRPGPGQVRFEYCFQGVGGGSVLISPDGKTINCGLAQAQSADDVIGFYTYPLTLSPTVAAQGRVAYQATRHGQALYAADLLWASPSGGTLVGALFPLGGNTAAVPQDLQIGVISNGLFTPLRIPASLAKSTVAGIAF